MKKIACKKTWRLRKETLLTLDPAALQQAAGGNITPSVTGITVEEC